MKKNIYRTDERWKKDEYDSLMEKVELSGLSRTQYIKNSVSNSTVQQLDKDFNRRDLYLKFNLTNNMNQIAYRCNSRKSIDYEVLKKLHNIELHLSRLKVWG